MRHLPKALFVVALAVGVATLSPAIAREGLAAFAHGNCVQAARSLAALARRGNPRAMALLGFLYEHGLGVPQSYDAAASLYVDAAERGDPTGQHLLGLMYDKGHGLERDDVLAYKWLSLAAAAAPAREREPYLRIRDAVASKMSLAQIMEGQRLALDWRLRP
ncbi:MAG TPA: tetratricopeptide repeat protein [Bradyrhizobium sp.]|nr:tetratricopeptide repeat protein [Bradyrhizobium sp.]